MCEIEDLKRRLEEITAERDQFNEDYGNVFRAAQHKQSRIDEAITERDAARAEAAQYRALLKRAIEAIECKGCANGEHLPDTVKAIKTALGTLPCHGAEETKSYCAICEKPESQCRCNEPELPPLVTASHSIEEHQHKQDGTINDIIRYLAARDGQEE